VSKILSTTRAEKAEQLRGMIAKEPEKFVERFLDMEEMILTFFHGLIPEQLQKIAL